MIIIIIIKAVDGSGCGREKGPNAEEGCKCRPTWRSHSVNVNLSPTTSSVPLICPHFHPLYRIFHQITARKFNS